MPHLDLSVVKGLKTRSEQASEAATAVASPCSEAVPIDKHVKLPSFELPSTIGDND